MNPKCIGVNFIISLELKKGTTRTNEDTLGCRDLTTNQKINPGKIKYLLEK